MVNVGTLTVIIHIEVPSVWLLAEEYASGEEFFFFIKEKDLIHCLLKRIGGLETCGIEKYV